MSTGTVIVIAVAVAVLAVLVTLAAQSTLRRRRLRRRFGPEYDRLARERNHRHAEAELADRERRHAELDIRPLTPQMRERYATQWAAVQEHFVDTPQRAVVEADELIRALMGERGYPTEGHDQMVADLSVEHARTLDDYRAAHEISARVGRGEGAGGASTEDLRQAMVRYRALFADLLSDSQGRGGRPTTAGAIREAIQDTWRR